MPREFAPSSPQQNGSYASNYSMLHWMCNLQTTLPPIDFGPTPGLRDNRAYDSNAGPAYPSHHPAINDWTSESAATSRSSRQNSIYTKASSVASHVDESIYPQSLAQRSPTWTRNGVIDKPWASSAAPSSEWALDDDDSIFDGVSLDSESSEDEPEPSARRQTTSSTSSDRTKADFRCWDHGCDGRVFTTASNLTRHQREKSCARPAYYCPTCGAYFSRSTARNKHVDYNSCSRIRRYSNGRQRPRKVPKES